MGKLDNLGSVVTGAGEGIGSAIAKELASQGSKVACVDFNRESGEKTVNEINGSGGERDIKKFRQTILFPYHVSF